MTGRGHSTDRAILLGLSGEAPDRIDPDQVSPRCGASASSKCFPSTGVTYHSHEEEDLRFRVDKTLSFHSNGMRYGRRCGRAAIMREVYFSVGGGFVVDEMKSISWPRLRARSAFPIPLPARSNCSCTGDRAQAYPGNDAHQAALRSDQVRSGLLNAGLSDASIDRGASRGHPPGGLNVRRRAGVARRLAAQSARKTSN